MATITVNSIDDQVGDTSTGTQTLTLREAINFANQNPGTTIAFKSGLGTILLAGNMPIIYATGTMIDGSTAGMGGVTIDGADKYRPFFVSGLPSTLNGETPQAISATIANVKVQNALAQGGTGEDGGGGGLGAGGALFVNTNASVTLRNDTFMNDKAAGGGAGSIVAGFGGGGGLGGNGGKSGGGGGGLFYPGGDQAGGGGGITSAGGTGSSGSIGSGGGGYTGGTGGAGINGTGGGGGGNGDFSTGSTGGVGLFGGGGGFGVLGGAGGFGGGGGGGSTGGAGGFGGGGGVGLLGGNGGFGGGGGLSSGNVGSVGGFGGGNGVGVSSGPSGFSFGAGGGGAMGGTIFVASGGALEIDGALNETGGVVTPGAPLNSGQSGARYGAGIFYQGGNDATNKLTVGGTGGQLIEDDIADYLGSGGTNPASSAYPTAGTNPADQGGALAITKNGAGTLTLSGNNSYTGGTTISSGTLELNSTNAAGRVSATDAAPGVVTFAGEPATLQFDTTAFSGTNYNGGVLAFSAGNTLDLRNLSYSTAATATYNGSSLIVSNGTNSDTLSNFTASSGITSASFAFASDGSTGTLVTVIPATPPASGGGSSVGTPSANSQTTTTTQNIPDPIVLTGSDPDSPALPLTYALASQPTNGTLSNFNAATGAVTYKPNAGYVGPDSFTFTDSNGTNSSQPATVGIAVTPPPTNNTPTSAPAVAFDPSVSVLYSTATLTGTVSAAAGVRSVELYEGTSDDPNRVDLGAASVNSDGTWSFNYDNGPGFHTNLQAVATDLAGQQTTAPSYFDLTTGITGEPYAVQQDSYDTAYDYEGSTFFKRSGKVYETTQYTANPDGSSVYVYLGGTAFDKTPYFAYGDHYAADGTTLTSEDVYYKDGHQTVQGLFSGETLNSIYNDTFLPTGGSNTFVFTKGFGDDTLTSFILGGTGRDTVSLQEIAPAAGSSETQAQADAKRLANILAHATGDGQGDTTIKIGQGDTITFAGVSVAQLQKHAGDFVFHA